MATYFGQQTQTGTDNPSGPLIMWTDATFACSGTGNQNIQELSCFLFTTGTVHMRVGVYNSAGTVLVAEGTASITVAGGSLAWQGHMAQANVKAAGGASPGVLVGGTSYRLAFALDATISNFGKSDGVQSHYTVGTDYTGGMPSALPAQTDVINFLYCIRCGVDPAASPFPGGAVGFRTTVVP